MINNEKIIYYKMGGECSKFLCKKIKKTPQEFIILENDSEMSNISISKFSYNFQINHYNIFRIHENIKIVKLPYNGKNNTTSNRVKIFDDCFTLNNLLNYHIKTIKFWMGYDFLYGFQFVYKNIFTGALKCTPTYGNDSGSENVFTLNDNEFIINMRVYFENFVLYGIEFILNNKRILFIGRIGGDQKDLQLKDKVIVGFHGLLTLNLPSTILIGAYIVDERKYIIKNVRAYYIFLKNKIKNKNLQNIIKQLQNKKNNSILLPYIAFGKLCTLPKDIFNFVILYIK